MNPKSHTEKVVGEATEKKAKTTFRCDNCGATFTSEGERRAHDDSEHGGKKSQGGGQS